MPDDDATTPTGPVTNTTSPAASTGIGVLDPPLARPAPRTRTMVLALILLVIGGCVLTAQTTDINVDPGGVALGVMVVAGLLLIAGALRRTT